MEDDDRLRAEALDPQDRILPTASSHRPHCASSDSKADPDSARFTALPADVLDLTGFLVPDPVVVEENDGRHAPKAAFGRRCVPDAEIDLDHPCLVLEIRRLLSDGTTEKDPVAGFFLVEDLTSAQAGAVVDLLHGHSDLLLHRDVMIESAGLSVSDDFVFQIQWTDEVREVLRTFYDADVLFELPHGAFREGAWEIASNLVIVPPEEAVDPSGWVEDATCPSVVVCEARTGKDEKESAILGILARRLPVRGPGTSVHDAPARLDALSASFPWMSHVVDLVREDVEIAEILDRPWRSMRPILIHGPSGCGKTRFASRLADALGIGFAGMSLSGSTDSHSIEGVHQGYRSSEPSYATRAIAQTLTANPMIFVDEIEKVDSTYNGDPRRVLMSMIDPETSSAYLDIGLSRNVDLSNVSWIFAANEVQLLDVAFRDRVRVVSVSMPDVSHMPVVVDGVMDDLAAAYRVDRSVLPDLGDIALAIAEDAYRTSKSMRHVSRAVSEAVRRRLVARHRERRSVGTSAS